MKTYKLYTYTGLVWLKDCGTFELFDEAQDKLLEELELYCQDSANDEERQANEEVFLFNSRIEESEG